jgi:hypothetical protein
MYLFPGQNAYADPYIAPTNWNTSCQRPCITVAWCIASKISELYGM